MRYHTDMPHRIRLAPDGALSQQRVPAIPGSCFVLEFSPHEGTLERRKEDLAITFDNGASIILQNFFGLLLQDEHLTLIPSCGEVLFGDALKTAFIPCLTGRAPVLHG